MKRVALGPAAPADAAALARILGDWVRGTGWMPVLHSRAEDLAFLSGLIGRQAVLVVRRGGAAVGFIAADGGEVTALHVAADQRGRGIGKALLDAVRAGAPSLSLWTFQANSRAIAFYRREGFAEAGRTEGAENEEGLPDLRMIWRRAP